MDETSAAANAFKFGGVVFSLLRRYPSLLIRQGAVLRVESWFPVTSTQRTIGCTHSLSFFPSNLFFFFENMSSLRWFDIVCPAFAAVASACAILLSRRQNQQVTRGVRTAVRAVNYHLPRQCNYECRFCFHTAKSSHVATRDEAKSCLKMLADAGMEKINFAGGEPLLVGPLLGELCRYCKVELKQVVSIVTNGSKLNASWMDYFARYVDIVALSCDSADSDTNVRIGRRDRNTGKTEPQVEVLRRVAGLCETYQVKLKINTVVCSENANEDMNALIDEVKPFRWKVFQVLKVDGENAGGADLRDVNGLLITTDQFRDFQARHRRQVSMVVEDNETMRNSYLMLDEHLCLLDNSGGAKRQSPCVLAVGVAAAVANVLFDATAFERRNGDFFADLKDIEDFGTAE